MQGTSADLIKMAMVAVQEWLEAERLQSLLVMQVHDELVLDVPAAEVDLVSRHLPGLLCNVAKLSVPTVDEVGMGTTDPQSGVWGKCASGRVRHGGRWTH